LFFAVAVSTGNCLRRITLKLYEAMFIVDSALAERDYAGVTAEIESIVKKHGGAVVDQRKWDDRRLAYEIGRMKRATYILVHFEAPPLSIETMRRDFVLSEKIVRHMITLDADGVPAGDERPGITSTAIPDFPDRGFREGRPGRARSADERDGAAVEEKSAVEQT